MALCKIKSDSDHFVDTRESAGDTMLKMLTEAVTTPIGW